MAQFRTQQPGALFGEDKTILAKVQQQQGPGSSPRGRPTGTRRDPSGSKADQDAGSRSQPENGVLHSMPSGLPLRALPFYRFIHIQKTAGTSMRMVLRRMFGSEFTFYTTLAGLQKKMRADTDPLVLDDNFFGRYLLFGGHIPYSHPAMRKNPHKRKQVYLALWRDPVARVISQYDHVRRHSDHHLFNELSKLSLLQAFNASQRFRDMSINHQLQYTFGAKDPSVAKTMLERHPYIIATTKHIEKFVDAVAIYSGLARPSRIPRVNTSSHGKTTELPPAREQDDFGQAAQAISEANSEEQAFIEEYLHDVLVTTPHILARVKK